MENKIENFEKIEVENEEMDIFFILDRSGSMYGSENDTINGYNSFIEKQLSKNQNIKVTTILFDNEYETLYSQKPIKDIKPLTSTEYFVRGSTALLDAIGKTVTNYERTTNNALCIITTDGLENASKEFNKKQIKEMIENHKWNFIFIGSGIDSYAEAKQIGIRRDYVANYKKSREGISDLFDAVDCAVDFCYCESDRKIDKSWKEKLEV